MYAGKKALWKHNVYGLTPSIGSAHHLLVLMTFDSFIILFGIPLY